MRRNFLLVIITAALLGRSAFAVAAQSSSVEPSPAPTRLSSSEFNPPFRYNIPEAMSPHVSDRYEAFELGVGVPEEEELPDNGLGRRPYGDTQTEAATTGARGVVVADVTDVVTHDCLGGTGRVPVGDEPSAFLDDLIGIAGLHVKDMDKTTLGGWPAVSAITVGGECEIADVHLPSNDYIRLDIPSRIVVAEVAGSTIMVDAWAGTPDDLASWLPVAQEFIDSIDFLTREERMRTPEPQSSPSN